MRDPAEIAHRAIHDDARDPDPLRMREHELADNRVCEVAAGIDDENVAGFGAIQGGVHHQVVARSLLNVKPTPAITPPVWSGRRRRPP